MLKAGKKSDRQMKGGLVKGNQLGQCQPCVFRRVDKIQFWPTTWSFLEMHILTADPMSNGSISDSSTFLVLLLLSISHRPGCNCCFNGSFPVKLLLRTNYGWQKLTYNKQLSAPPRLTIAAAVSVAELLSAVSLTA